jgi:excisionase family DNA binding protein
MTNPTDTKKPRGRRPGTPNRPREKQPLARLSYRINELSEALGISRAAIYRAIRNGTIRTTKIGKNRLIPVKEAERLLTPR